MKGNYAKAPEVAERLGLSSWRVYELARQDVIPHARVGAKQILFNLEAIDDWLARGGSREPGAWRQGTDR